MTDATSTFWDEWYGSLDGRIAVRIKHLLAWRGRRLDLHKIVAADQPDCFHSHPAFAVRVILRGGYIEQMLDGALRTWRPGMIGVVRPELVHRIHALLDGASFSLWFRGRRLAPIYLHGDGYQHQEQTHRAPNTEFAHTSSGSSQAPTE